MKRKEIILFFTIFLSQINHGQIILEALEGGVPNACFSTATISRTPCNTIAGATLNDDLTTPMGIEYNWTGATGFVDGGSVRAIVEINGQCWFRRNAVNLPTNYPAPVLPSDADLDTGWSGFYANTYVAERGRLYQWKAAMNYVLPFSTGTSSINNYLVLERARGICPVGWHVPSDCEWQYLEDYVQVPSQYLDKEMSWNARTFPSSTNTGSGTFLSAQVPTAPNNQTGFSVLIFGYRDRSNMWGSSQRSGFWTSTLHSYNSIHNLSGFFSRELLNFYVGIQRMGQSPANAYSIRCLKD
jgi:uncharacterized protein (TIGR02145 family)